MAWSITGPRHAGITVSDLDRSLAFYCGLLGLELLWRRLYDEPEITRIVGVPEATGLEIAMLVVPCDWGTGHFCFFVTGIEELYGELRERGVSFRSDGPVEMTAGANRGGKSLYSLDPDGYVIELHERAG
jgi:lactoylglutathione lyase